MDIVREHPVEGGRPATGLPHLPPIGRVRAARVQGFDVAWAEAGEGPPLVLLHGLGDWHRTWRRVAPLLAERHRLLMLDLPGHGLSDRPDAPYTLRWFAGVVDAWMQAIGLPSAHFCGHSYGGGVAQYVVLHHPARVDRLALVASGGLGRDVTLPLRLASLPGLDRLMAPLAMRLGTRVALAVDRATFGYPEPGEAAAMAAVNARPGTGRAFSRTVQAVIDVHGQRVQTCREAAAAASIPPVALFWGSEDRILPLAQGRMARERFAGATLSIFEGCGHFPHLHDPLRFEGELAAFLADPDRAPARVLFACPGGPGAPGLPVGRCSECTFR